MPEALLNANILGLAYDGIGVGVLGLPSLITGARDIHRESGTYWDSNGPLLERMVLQKFDTTAGSVMLITGFLLQLLAALKVSLVAWVATVLWVALFALPLMYFLVWRGKWASRFVKQVEAHQGTAP